MMKWPLPFLTRKFDFTALLTVVLYLTVTIAVAAQDAAGPFRFRDVGKETGFLPAAAGIQGHGAGWGDVDGDGWADLYIGTFHYKQTQPNLFFRNHNGQLKLDNQPQLRISTRATGVLFADLDNDGDLDLYVGSMPAADGSRLAKRTGHPLVGCSLFRNDSGEQFTDISKGNQACPDAFGGRSVTVLDSDGDGLLDLLVGEDPVSGYNGSKTRTSRLFRNLGDLQFEDVSRRVGIPEDAAGLGVAAADVNGDGWPDLFMASTLGNLLMLNDGTGRFREAAGAHDTFAWPAAKGDDMVCGVAISDVNGDALPDIVLGQHFSAPWRTPIPNRLYLNRGITNGIPQFEDVTEAARLLPLPLKGPHVEIQDFDNDGRPDIYTSIVKFSNGQPHPVIFQDTGNKHGIPQFDEHVLSLNDFPADEDRAIRRSGKFFEKMLADRKIIYSAPGPTCDFDRDGRLDMVLPSWWVESPSLLLKNETDGGHWLDVQVAGSQEVNTMGIGSRVDIFESGRNLDTDARIGSREITTGFGYASSQEPVAHFGLGNRAECDVVVTLPHGKGRIVQKAVKADRRITISP